VTWEIGRTAREFPKGAVDVRLDFDFGAWGHASLSLAFLWGEEGEVDWGKEGEEKVLERFSDTGLSLPAGRSVGKDLSWNKALYAINIYPVAVPGLHSGYGLWGGFGVRE